MPTFTKSQVIILPRALEYQELYGISLQEVLACLNNPDHHTGIATDHYTAEKDFPTHRVYVYYYRTYPLKYLHECYAIVDFIGYTEK